MKSGFISSFSASADAYLNNGGLDNSIFATPDYLDHMETKDHRKNKSKRSLNRKKLFQARMMNCVHKKPEHYKKCSPNSKIKGNSYHYSPRLQEIKAKVSELEQRSLISN